jgi:hypothetical protein
VVNPANKLTIVARGKPSVEGSGKIRRETMITDAGLLSSEELGKKLLERMDRIRGWSSVFLGKLFIAVYRGRNFSFEKFHNLDKEGKKIASLILQMRDYSEWSDRILFEIETEIKSRLAKKEYRQ